MPPSRSQYFLISLFSGRLLSELNIPKDDTLLFPDAELICSVRYNILLLGGVFK